MQRAVGSLPFCSSWLAKLSSCGFENVEDLQHVGVVELSKEIGVSNSEALEIIQVAKRTRDNPPPPPTDLPQPSPCNQTPQNHSNTDSPRSSSTHISGHTALELLHREQAQGSIVTFCAGIDAMMGGGVALGKVTEFCGGPGLGKTQMSIQLAVDVSIPEPLGGVGGEAVYIDTEGSFIIERVAEIAGAAVRHINSMADDASTDEVVKQAAGSFSLETVLSSIHLYRCHDCLELLATVNVLPDFLQHHPRVRLVVIDSIAAHFRHGFDDMSRRNRLLGVISQNLIQLATLHSIAVVLTNQMTTKVSRGVKNSAQLIPALGESWGHASTVRVVMFWSDTERRATLYKSPTQKEDTVCYVITADGIRDVLSPADSSSQTPISASQCVPYEEDFEIDDTNYNDEDVIGDTTAVEAELDNNFVSVSSLPQDDRTSGMEQGHRGRKRPHPSDPEL